MKKLITIVLTLILVIALASPAFAASTTYNYKIKRFDSSNRGYYTPFMVKSDEDDDATNHFYSTTDSTKKTYFTFANEDKIRVTDYHWQSSVESGGTTYKLYYEYYEDMAISGDKYAMFMRMDTDDSADSTTLEGKCSPDEF